MKLGDEGPRDKPQQDVTTAGKTGNAGRGQGVPGEHRGPGPQPTQRRALVRRGAYEADLGARGSPHGLTNNAPDDRARTEHSDHGGEPLHREHLEIERRQADGERDRTQRRTGVPAADSCDRRARPRARVPADLHPDRQPAEMYPRAGPCGRRLAPDLQAADRGRQLPTDHVAQCPFLAEHEHSSLADRRGKTGQPHRQSPVASTKGPVQHGLSGRNVDSAPGDGLDQPLPNELAVGRRDRLPVNSKPLAQRPDARQTGSFGVSPLPDPRLEQQGDLAPCRHLRSAMDPDRCSRIPPSARLQSALLAQRPLDRRGHRVSGGRSTNPQGASTEPGDEGFGQGGLTSTGIASASSAASS